MKRSMDHEDAQQLFTSYVDSALLAQVPNVGQLMQAAAGERPRARRRRRKAPRCDGGGDAAGGDPKKRRLSDEQAEFLETSFREERKLETGRKVQLAAELGLDPKQVAVWFQNRRARHKSKQLEEEFVKLKSAHDAAILDKCHLENEVLKLKERLLVAEEEVKKLKSAAIQGVRGDGGFRGGVGGGRSPSSSFSTDASRTDLGGDALENDLMYVPDDYDYAKSMMEWVNLYGLM